MSSTLGRVRLVLVLLWHHFWKAVAFLISFLTVSMVKISIESFAGPPCAPVEYFVSAKGEVVGYVGAAISMGLSLRFLKKMPNRWQGTFDLKCHKIMS